MLATDATVHYDEHLMGLVGGLYSTDDSSGLNLGQMKSKQKFENLSFVRYTGSSIYGNTGCNCIVQGTFSSLMKRNNDVDNYSLYVIKDDKIAGIFQWAFTDDIELSLVQDETRARSMVNEYLALQALEDI